MADTKRPQNESGNLDEAARRGSGAVAATAQAIREALDQGRASGAQAAEQGGRIISDTLRRSSEAGTEFLRRAGDSATESAGRSTQLVAEAQQRLAQDTAGQLKEAGQKLAQTQQQTAEDLRLLMPLPSPAGDGLQEAQQAFAGLGERTTRAHLRLTQELFRLANPAPVIEIQRRFVQEYLGALVESQVSLLRAARHSAEQALRPIERQLEQRRRGRQGVDQEGRPAGRVAEVMSPEVRVVNPEDTVQQVARIMRHEDVGVLPVGENDRLVGMVTDRDVAVRLVAEGKDPARTKVREVMTSEVRYVFEDEDV